jgi:hypothetical protein
MAPLVENTSEVQTLKAAENLVKQAVTASGHHEGLTGGTDATSSSAKNWRGFVEGLRQLAATEGI